MARKHGESLADYVRRVRADKNLSLSDVERNSIRRGEKIAGSYVSRIENGVADPDGVTPKKLVALAYGLGVSVFEVFGVAIGRPLEADDAFTEEKEIIWEMYTDIPRQCQKDVIDLLTVLQKNHSLSQRRARIAEHREDAARRRVVAGPTRVATPLPDPTDEDEYARHKRALEDEPLIPAKKPA